jgi:hypothetical protein
VSWAQVNGIDDGFLGDGQSTKARFACNLQLLLKSSRAWLFFSFFVAFGALFSAVWMGIQVWVRRPQSRFCFC